MLRPVPFYKKVSRIWFKLYPLLCKVIRDAWVKNRIVSAVNRQQFLIDLRELKKKNSIRQWIRDRKQEKKVQLAARHSDGKKAIGTWTRSNENRTCEEAGIRTTSENMKDDSRSVSAFFLMLFLFSKRCRLSFHSLFRSFRRLLKKHCSE